MEELLPDRALQVAFSRLDCLKLGDEVIVAEFAPNRPQVFIECAKEYHRLYGNLLFSNDYSKIKKVRSFSEWIDL